MDGAGAGLQDNAQHVSQHGARAAAAPQAAVTANQVLAELRGIIGEDLAPLAKTIDQDGFYPVDLFRKLGAAGAFGLHLCDQTRLAAPDMAAAIEAMAAMGEECMSTAFCAWCQDTCGWYLENSQNPELRTRLQPDIGSARILGGTGLSNPMKSLSGIEAFRLQGERVDGGYMVSGVLPWVSNLGDGHWFGSIFQLANDPAHTVMAMFQCGQPGVEIRRSVRFIALEGTGTLAVLVRRAFVPDANVLADPLGDMARRVRPGLMLLQSGMGFGVIIACIAMMQQADRSLSHTNCFLPRRAEEFAAEEAALRARVLALAKTPLHPGPDYLREVLAARLAVSELALAASQAALLHSGARGYLEGSPVHRRLRESYFVAIITPSVKHLRQELAGFGPN